MAGNKKRVIKSLENLSEDLRELLRAQYPAGYETSITRIINAKKEPIFVFPLETDNSIYLVKVPATKNSSGGYDVESGAPEEFDKSGDDDDLASTAKDDDFERDGDDGYDEEGGTKSSREASYDPDFDN